MRGPYARGVSEHPVPCPAPAPAARPGAVRLTTVERTGSTNDDLRRALTGPDGRLDPEGASRWPHLSALRAVVQTSGRGRSGHGWETPPTGALTVSYVLRLRLAPEALGWVPLVVGLAVRDAVEPLLEGTGLRARTKWPNDVLLEPLPGPQGRLVEELPGWGRARKLAGILAELVPAADGAAPAVVVGVGLNAGQAAEELPVAWAASLRTAGSSAAEGDLDALAVTIGERIGRLLAELEEGWEAAGSADTGTGGSGRRAEDSASADSAGSAKKADSTGRPPSALLARLEEACATLGQRVSVMTPSGPVEGTAERLEPGLVLATDQGGCVVVSAGDVSLARLAGPQDR